MPIPLAVSIPAAAAALSYLDAKSGFWYDRKLLRGGIRALWQSNYRQWKDRCNLFYRLEQRAQEKSSANRPFLLHNDRTWTYAQAYDMALRYGTYFKDTLGVKPKDVVAINLQNSDHFVLVVFGLWSIGAKPAFINYNLTSDPLVHCVNVAKATLMLVDPEVAKNVDDDVRAKIGGLRIELLTPELIREVETTAPTRAPDTYRIGEIGRDMAILIYTSGTTGLPKAAVIGWGKLTLAGNFCAGWLDTKPTDIFYTCMPLYHSSATSMGLSQCLEAGCTLAIGKKFSTKTFWNEARAHRATIVQYVGETCRYLLAAPPQLDPATGANLDQQHCIRMAFGNGLRPDVWEKFRERFGIRDIAEFYGATEGPLATWNLTSNSFSSGAIGRNGWVYGLAMRHKMSIVCVDEDSEPGKGGSDGLLRDPKTGLCQAVRPGAVGELLFALPGTDVEREFQGYYGDAAATKAKVARDVFRRGDAYFRSGDLVSWDSEGRVYFHDRIGDTFRWKSENVATTEVAQALGSHDRVAEANVYGVLLPHHDGRAGAAAVVLRGGEGPDEKTLRSLAEHVRAKLPKYAVPLFVRVSDDLGHAVTGTNKQQKHHLRVEGVDPDKVGSDRLFWLREGTYVPFGPKEWQKLNAGEVKL
ncbi:long-chain fatty acid transporter fat1 [Diatrype stigma]|uniref:Very long-chain fatty acid transport protein n=1 Tax=Diatrype stigma TaxID=117547 RepID=A0AAN9US97_9PEZI